jgi:uncharacterized protein
MRDRVIGSIFALSLAPALAGCAGENPGCVADQVVAIGIVLPLLILGVGSGGLPSRNIIPDLHCENTKTGSPRVSAHFLEELSKQVGNGDAETQDELGSMYYYGQGVSKDYAFAIAWYRKSADQGNAKAQYDLGWMYDSGYGAPHDDAQAYKWVSLAASEGYQFASGCRDLIEERMTPAQIAEAKRLACEWKPVGVGVTTQPTASVTPNSSVSPPIAPASAGPASSHPRIGPV